MFIQAAIGAAVTAAAALFALQGTNPAISADVPFETDLAWMRKAIEALPPCHFNAYGSVSCVWLVGTWG